MRADLDRDLVLLGGGDHRPALFDRAAGGLLHVNVLAGLGRVHHAHAMPVIGRGHDHGVDVLALQQIAVVAVNVGLGAGDLGGVFQVPVVGVADGREVDLAAVGTALDVVQVAAAHAADAHVADGQLPIGPLAALDGKDPGRNEVGQACGGGGRREELTSLELVHGCPPCAVGVIHVPRDTRLQLNRRPGRLQAGRRPPNIKKSP